MSSSRMRIHCQKSTAGNGYHAKSEKLLKRFLNWQNDSNTGLLCIVAIPFRDMVANAFTNGRQWYISYEYGPSNISYELMKVV